MTEPDLRSLARSHRLKTSLLMASPLVAIGVVWGTLSNQVDANAADINRLEQTTLSVARIDTEIQYIKESVVRVEKSEEKHHRENLQILVGLQQELRYLRMRESPDIPPTIKGMIPEPISQR